MKSEIISKTSESIRVKAADMIPFVIYEFHDDCGYVHYLMRIDESKLVINLMDPREGANRTTFCSFNNDAIIYAAPKGFKIELTQE